MYGMTSVEMAKAGRLEGCKGESYAPGSQRLLQQGSKIRQFVASQLQIHVVHS